MVQQVSFVAQMGAISPAGSIAVPAVANSQQSPNNYFQQQQQQILKNNQQQQQQQQQYIHQQHHARMNNLAQVSQQQQHYVSQQENGLNVSQPHVESLYNGTSNGVQLYKPQYFSQQQQSIVQQQPIYPPQAQRQVQQQQAYYQPQQQSPSGLQSTNRLSVRHLQQTGNQMLVQSALAASSSQDQHQQQQQQQMQHLIMSYQQQQQQQHNLNLMPVNASLLQQQQPLVSNYASDAKPNMSQQQLQVSRNLDSVWPQNETNKQAGPSSQPSQRKHRHYSRQFSDRDSMSTLSRFDQLDERRSFTMRSQCTNVHNATNYSNRFGFFQLTCEALKRTLGLGDQQLANRKQTGETVLARNSALPVASPNKNSVPVPRETNGSSNSTNLGKITVIDSAEDYYFNRRVFRCQLLLTRLLCFICGALVLASPVVMLLLPKLEFIFSEGQDLSDASVLSSNSEHQVQASMTNSHHVKHSVGLIGRGSQSGGNAQHQQQHQSGQQRNFRIQPQWRISECGSDCDGLLVGFVARFCMLCVAYWAIFFRAQTANLPRIDFQRCLLVSLALLLTSAYWLFFVFRLFDKRFADFELQYSTIVQFASSLLESLILLHYLAVVLLELRHRKKIYCLKVVRSPDGESQYYSCGALSIQKCAEFVLEKYHRDFKQYGPYAQHLLQLESERASALASKQTGDDRQPETQQSRGSRQRSESRSSRHHSRAYQQSERSPSRSPARSTRSRSQRSRPDVTSKGSTRTRGAEQEEQSKQVVTVASNELEANGAEETQQQQQQERDKRHDGSENEQSSDATSRLNESSLETIRAANSTSDLIIGQSQSLVQKPNSSRARDEAESVRSVRSRRSHYRHRDHRERDRDRDRDRDHSLREGDQSSRLQSQNAFDSSRHSQAVDQMDEHERKLRRRKLRLLTTVEETFENIKRIHSEGTNGNDEETAAVVAGKQPLSSAQTARLMYPSFARSLQKYLRLTKQTGRHNLQSIYDHLNKCLLYKLSARAFLERFFNQDPVWQQNESNLFASCRLAEPYQQQAKCDSFELNSWSLICDTLLSRQVSSGTFFLLKQGQVSLLVSVARLPHLNLTEQVIDDKSCKFVLVSNSETSV